MGPDENPLEVRFPSLVNLGSRTPNVELHVDRKRPKDPLPLGPDPFVAKPTRNGWRISILARSRGYDDFRKRLLQGREDVYQELGAKVDGGTWVDFGGGTGANLEFIGPALKKFQKVYVVDLAESRPRDS